MRCASKAQVKVGTKLRADGGFTCLRDGDELTVESDDGGLFVRCSSGTHHLDGQLRRGRYIGLTVVATAGKGAAK